ncbi:hypothetical protein BRD56_01430 [Thermoplasmatales archaeon SW_10_69_26]|jgi:hypothetical protein|nr:MAG: hypothetical protein BRD56_01430 [Thermoplasmatales archaeon SW_10_69_26]
MEFNRSVTWGTFVAVIALATIAMVAFVPMTTSTIFMMVLPSMVVFGLLMMWLGMQHGEFRARP